MNGEAFVNLLNRDLPKWPMMLVTGVPVSEDRAKEIIRRTDRFFSHDWRWNNHAQWIVATLGIPRMSEFATTAEQLQEYNLKRQAWRDSWGILDTSYILNDWISSPYINGPYGWCHPDGQIGFVDNVGKWPTVTEIFEEWSMLAVAFPFLSLGITLYDREFCEPDQQPVVCMKVHEGTVTLHDPEDLNVHEGHPEATQAPADTPESGGSLSSVRHSGEVDYGLARRLCEADMIQERLTPSREGVLAAHPTPSSFFTH